MNHIRAHGIAVGLMIVLAIASYRHVLDYEFMFDDQANIVANHAIRLTEIDAEGLKRAATESHAKRRPVANVSFALNHYLCFRFLGAGHEYTVSWFRLTNIVIHVITGLLVYLFTYLTMHVIGTRPGRNDAEKRPRKLSDRQRKSAQFVALIAGGLWFANPIQTQAVTYVVQRMTSMATMFYMAAFCCYVLARMSTRGGRWGWWVGGVIGFGLAVFTKEIALTLPVIILLYEWYFFRGSDPKWLKQALKFSPILVVLVVIGVIVGFGTDPLNGLEGAYRHRDFTMWERVMTEWRIVVLYLSLFLLPLPSRLNFTHEPSVSTTLFAPFTTTLSLLFLLGMVVAGIYLHRRQSVLSFGIFWFLLNLVLESSVIGLELVFEHRVYLPSVGIAIAVAYAWHRWGSKHNAIRYAVPVIVVFLLAMGTYSRNLVWKSKGAMWEDCVLKSPHSPRANCNIGAHLLQIGKLDPAMRYLGDALKLDPEMEDIHINFGALYIFQKKYKKAEYHLKETIRLQPDSLNAYTNLGVLYTRTNEYEKAAESYRKAVDINPFEPGPLTDWGRVLALQGRRDEAIEKHRQALEKNASHVPAYIRLGNIYLAAGELDEAIQNFTTATKLAPDDSTSFNNLGAAYMRNKQYSGAIANYKKAIALRPDYVKAHTNLANVYSVEKQPSNALAAYENALRYAPNHFDALIGVGRAYGQLERFDEAVTIYKGLRDRYPDNQAVIRELYAMRNKANIDPPAP